METMLRKAVFLDRDGVINEIGSERVKYVNKPEDLRILPGVAEGIAQLRRLGYLIFVVTNQGGVGLGYMKRGMLEKIHEKMMELLQKEHPEALIDDIAYCHHRPNSGCPCRKPKPGMILELAQKHKIKLAESWMVGDRDVDIMAGQKAGCRTALITPEFTLLDFSNRLAEGEKA